MSDRPPRRVALLAGLLVFAGCTGAGPAAPTTTGPAHGTPPTTDGPTTATPPDWSGADSRPFRNLTVGAPGDLPEDLEAHEYTVWNNRSSARRITVTLYRDDTLVLNRTLEFPAEGVLRVEVFRPGEYTAVIDPAGADRRVLAGPGFTCNYKGVRIAVGPDGTVTSIVTQTMMACSTGTVTE